MSTHNQPQNGRGRCWSKGESLRKSCWRTPPERCGDYRHKSCRALWCCCATGAIGDLSVSASWRTTATTIRKSSLPGLLSQPFPWTRRNNPRVCASRCNCRFLFCATPSGASFGSGMSTIREREAALRSPRSLSLMPIVRSVMPRWMEWLPAGRPPKSCACSRRIPEGSRFEVKSICRGQRTGFARCATIFDANLAHVSGRVNTAG